MNIPAGLRKSEAMYFLFGREEGKKCKDCPHIVRHGWGNRNYIKCEMYGNSNSEATDWALSWTACGLINGDHWRMYQIAARDGCVVNMLKHEPKGRKKEREEIEGQIRMEGF